MPNIVYVIELRPDVMDIDRWRRKNPEQTTDECYYVGQSAHSAECRFKQHCTPQGTPCTCICHFKPGEHVRQNAVGSAKYASTHHVRLRPELSEHLGEFETAEDAEVAEHDLADDLRNAGHGAYSK